MITDTRDILLSIPTIINKTFPIPGRFRSKLPSDVAELSRLLTSSRGDRSLSYLNRPNLLSAYLHYFLPWNLYRLCLLLPSLDISLSEGDIVMDLGSGTLTFVSALWIARPDLRETGLEFYCVDRSGQALDAGKKFFLALSGESKWKIKLIREEIRVHELQRMCTFGTARIKEKKNVKLITAVNIFNELYEKVPHNNKEELKQVAKKAAQFMSKQAKEDAYILTVEPGVPLSGRFISFLREAFLESGHSPAAPCTHSAACPLAGSGVSTRAKKWCHFANEDFDPPKDLVRLSAAARLPKERLVYSYLLTILNHIEDVTKRRLHKENAIRVISDAFFLPGNKTGRYGCCEQGLVLLTGEKSRIEKLVSGSLVLHYTSTDRLDAKSGAAIMNL